MTNRVSLRWFVKLMRIDRTLTAAICILVCFILLGVGADFIANENVGLLPFGPETPSQEHKIYQAPGYSENYDDGSFRRHLLGTDEIGRDVLARLIHGTQVVLLVGFLSTLISFIIALILGSLSGYYGDRGLQTNVIDLLIGPVLLIFGATYLSYNFSALWSQGTFGILILIIYLFVLLGAFYSLYKFSHRIVPRAINVPIDTIVVKLLEVFRAVPALFIIIALFGLIQRPSIWSVIWIIGLLRWSTMTRLLRAEILRLKTENYVLSARLSGFSDLHILYKYIWPNTIGPMIVSSCFYVGTAILLESSLSFLGIGVPGNVVSWGSMLNASREYIDAWWVAVFPGLLIFLLILSVSVIGDRIRLHLVSND